MNDSLTPIAMGMFVGTYLPFSETFIYDQLVRQRRFESHVMAYERNDGAMERFPYAKVTALSAAERGLYLSMGLAPRFMHALRSAKARVIHAHFGTNGVYAARFARKLDLPLVVTFHGHDASGLLPRNRWTTRYARYQLFAAQMFDTAALVLCASQELADILSREVGVAAHKIRVHRLGVDLDKFQPVDLGDGPGHLLMIGRFVEKKGFEYGIRAFARVRREQPECTLRLVGDGPLAPQLRSLVRELGLERSVEFLGVLDSERVRQEMARANIFVAPSVVSRTLDRESGVIVIKEANACSLPAVGTRHGGIPEIIDDGVTGYLVPERSVDALADRIIFLATSPEERRRMGRQARQKIETEYDTVEQNQRLEALLATVL